MCLFSIGRDLLAVAEKLEASGVSLDSVNRSIEVGNFAVGGENFRVEHVANTALQDNQSDHILASREGGGGEGRYRFGAHLPSAALLRVPDRN